MNPLAKITLVGAGPGDPELITVKGIKALAMADVVMYDALIHPDILIYAPKRAEKIFVGKRSRNHTLPQPDINQLMVEKAMEKGHVVRLKGGDPFVFGRGMEEITFAESFGIPTEVVPGLSSSYALATANKFPLTQRGVNESFWVLTGTNSEGKLPSDLERAVQTQATVVILMGMGQLESIVEVYEAYAKAHLPAVVVQHGTLAEEKIVRTTVSHLISDCEKNHMGSPAVIYIGESLVHWSYSEALVLSKSHS